MDVLFDALGIIVFSIVFLFTAVLFTWNISKVRSTLCWVSQSIDQIKNQKG